jgi:hypothetical protein
MDKDDLVSRHSPLPCAAREYGYEKIALLDANGAEIGFVHRRGDAKAIIAASLESSQSELDDLKHDLERQMTIANTECNRAEELLEALREARDFVAIHGPAAAFPELITKWNALLERTSRHG